ncbi:MAG: hypothetical protein IJ514_02535 [Clostridia bacterium]|nr:hypothetical protein [Clostridia bacterium]
MGKKKSVVLMVLLTIVIVVLCAITVFPTFAVPGTVKKWTPAVMQYDLGSDLGGGSYAYYYPKGVISETEYKNNLEAKTGDEKTEYEESYVAHKGLYLLAESSGDKDYIYANDAVVQDFEDEFTAAAAEITARFKAKGLSDYRVSVVDDYALKVELPASETSASLAYSYFANMGELTIEKGGETVEELKEDGAKVSDLIKSVSVSSKYKMHYLKIKFTDAGKEMLAGVKDELSESTSSSDGSTTPTTLDIKLGDETLVQIYKDSVTDNNKEVRTYYVEAENLGQVETLQVLLSSAIENGGFDIEFNVSEIRYFEPVYGENALTLLYIALAVVIVALLVAPVVLMNRYGVVSLYASLSYLIIVGLCFAFITGGVFEITLGSMLVFLLGLVLVNVIQYHIFGAIRAELALHKTAESSVKGGYKKTLWGIVDIYAVLLLGALALLLGAAGLHTLALQAIVCVVTGAFINLLWARAINFTLLSASKDKYKYFRFVREDDDDE